MPFIAWRCCFLEERKGFKSKSKKERERKTRWLIFWKRKIRGDKSGGERGRRGDMSPALSSLWFPWVHRRSHDWLNAYAAATALINSGWLWCVCVCVCVFPSFVRPSSRYLRVAVKMPQKGLHVLKKRAFFPARRSSGVQDCIIIVSLYFFSHWHPAWPNKFPNPHSKPGSGPLLTTLGWVEGEKSLILISWKDHSVAPRDRPTGGLTSVLSLC